MKCRRTFLGWILVVLVPVLGSVAAQAADPEAELRALDEQLSGLERAVEQRERLSDPASDSAREGRSVVSSLSAFLEKVDVSGLVAAGGSWQKSSVKQTPAGPSVSDKDTTFQLYQGWIEIDKVPTEESRAGFNLAIEMGDLSTQAGDNFTPGIFSAYVSYLAPLGKGLRIDAGILPTALGAEHEKESLNWNITRGLVWYLQPITSTGVTLTYSLTDALSLMVGAINDPIASARTDTLTQKALTGQLSFQQDTWGLKAGVNYGSTQGRTLPLFDSPLPTFTQPALYRAGIYDFVFTWDPFENLGFWANFDYHFGEQPEGQPVDGIKAVALAIHLGATETIGFSFRYEWIGVDNPTEDRFQTFTVTMDHKATDSLTGRLEYRYQEQEEMGIALIKSNGIFLQWIYEF
ncbi:MAG: outer membrane beta-barrel protein [Myxococcota bacterium]